MWPCFKVKFVEILVVLFDCTRCAFQGGHDVKNSKNRLLIYENTTENVATRTNVGMTKMGIRGELRVGGFTEFIL